LDVAAEGRRPHGQREARARHKFIGDAWDEVKASNDSIVKCAEQCGSLIGVGGVGIKKFRLPRQGDASLDVDFADVGENFANKSDDDADDDDDGNFFFI
jgi:hypothetical protein